LAYEFASFGFHQKEKVDHWHPDQDLTDFLAKHQNGRILLVTYCSMRNPEPEVKTKTIMDILEQHKIPAIINLPSGGLIQPDKFNPELHYFVNQIPYDWIFPKIYGVIHHGGFGTTHLALKYGCASMIIPHIIDQFVWDKVISDLGAGPRGISINKITTRNLEPKILALFQERSFKVNAEKIAAQMQAEDFREELYSVIVD
jgi:UDP:flavonoid glycosyltransferase YjiC (YdhE family)